MAGISELSRPLEDIAPEKIDQPAILGRSTRAFHERKTGTVHDVARAAKITQRAFRYRPVTRSKSSCFI